MEKFVIEGGRMLSGSITPGGNKNEALPALAACLLTDETVVLNNVPEIKDVQVMLEVIENLGASVERLSANRYAIRADNLQDIPRPNRELCQRIRASILFAGPLLGRKMAVDLSPPGGDVIGRRRLDTHFSGFVDLGAIVEVRDIYRLRARTGLRGTDIFLDEQSVTATENLIMAACLAQGQTTLLNAACEPHVQNLCHLLNAMGAQIHGIGTNTVVINGVERLHGAEHNIGPDYLEIGSYAALAAVTGGELTINGVRESDLRMILKVFSRIGIMTDVHGETLTVPGRQELKVKRDLHGVIPKIDDAPWPAFPTDLMSIAITAATQSNGPVLFFEKMFEGRMFFVDSLISMGASIILCDPHRVVVAGPSQLYGATLESPDVRAGMALLIASLCARGRSTIYNIRQIDRGYEKIEQKLQSLGAAIERVGV
ncbi:MAG: UDP-N-acetylglucosamine 1-carboxyvinyltransferase [Myxococcales bacterium]|nr:UDP-N-acetylglucosamine 1-carboxyvinyltransferase [Myxococcales bacterium]